jgi:hypothetical protein
MPERNILLSKSEREMLTQPEKMSPRQKRNLNYQIKMKAAQIKQALQEIRLLIEYVAEDLLKESVSSEMLIDSIQISEKILKVLDPWAVGEPEKGELKAFRVWGSVIPACAPGKCTIDSASYTASDEEIHLHKRLKEHFNKIRFYVDPCIPDPVCRDPEYSRTQMDRLSQLVRRIAETSRPIDASLNRDVDKIIDVSFSAYLDETGVNESGWVLRAPTTIDIDQLQWMRWKPRGLKGCTEQPPLLEEKKLPGQWITVATLNESSSPDEIEKFNDAIKRQNESRLKTDGTK